MNCRWVWWWCQKQAWVPCKPKSGGSSPVITSIYGDEEYEACMAAAVARNACLMTLALFQTKNAKAKGMPEVGVLSPVHADSLQVRQATRN